MRRIWFLRLWRGNMKMGSFENAKICQLKIKFLFCNYVGNFKTDSALDLERDKIKRRRRGRVHVYICTYVYICRHVHVRLRCEEAIIKPVKF